LTWLNSYGNNLPESIRFSHGDDRVVHISEVVNEIMKSIVLIDHSVVSGATLFNTYI